MASDFLVEEEEYHLILYLREWNALGRQVETLETWRRSLVGLGLMCLQTYRPRLMLHSYCRSIVHVLSEQAQCRWGNPYSLPGCASIHQGMASNASTRCAGSSLRPYNYMSMLLGWGE